MHGVHIRSIMLSNLRSLTLEKYVLVNAPVRVCTSRQRYLRVMAALVDVAVT